MITTTKKHNNKRKWF